MNTHRAVIGIADLGALKNAASRKICLTPPLNGLSFGKLLRRR
jgi:hypothetical protein